MGYLAESYRDLNPLITDFYQLTMSKGYFDLKRKDEQATFYMHWRKPAYHDNAGYTTVAGVEGVVDFLKHFKFTPDKIAYLRSQKREGVRLFPEEFLHYLETTPLDLDVDAVPEGTVMTGAGPVIRVKGPLVQCQLVESAILQIMNSSAKIATRASRLSDAVGDNHPIADFSLRRSATLDTGVARSAFIGGISATATTNSAMKLGIPVTGTMAHAWVMSFAEEGVPNSVSELTAFKAYLESMPTNSVLLVDTYDAQMGIKNAIKASIETGIKLNGVRIDSGKLGEQYSIAKKLLTEARREHPDLFSNTRVFFTDGLKEETLKNLNDDIKKSAAETGDEYPLPAFGVGTQLGNPGALDGGVYKLSAHEKRKLDEILKQTEQDPFKIEWEPAMKVAGVDPKDPTIPHAKSSLPGVSLDTARMYDANGKMLGDVIVDTEIEDKNVLNDPLNLLNAMKTGKAITMADNRSLVNLPKPAKVEFLLKPLFRREKDAQNKPVEAKCLYDPPQKEAYEGGPMVTDLLPIQKRNREQRAALPEAVKSLDAPEQYPIFLDEAVHKTRKDIMAKMVAMNTPEPSESIDVLIDLQPGFSDKTVTAKEGGSLYVPEGEKTIRQAAELIKNSKGRTFVLSQDYHPENHISFMTNHPGVMAFRKKQLLAMAEPDSEAMNPMKLPFSEIVLGRDGNILGVKVGNEVHKVELEFKSGATKPSAKDRGRIAKVLDETLDEKFLPALKAKGAWTQTLWPPHCIQGTKSANFDPGLPLPAGLLRKLDKESKAPDVEYFDPNTGNHFYVIRKGMNSELDSYGIGIENDKRTRTTARNVFDRIAERFQEKMASKVHFNIGGLATNFCMEFSHNNIVDEIIGMFRISGMQADVNIIHDISRGIPIPGGRDDPFSLEGAFARMRDYNHGETKSITSRTLMLERGTPLPEISGAIIASGLPGNQQAIQ